MKNLLFVLLALLPFADGENKLIGLVEYDYIGTPRNCELFNKAKLYLYEDGAMFIYGDEGTFEPFNCDKGMEVYQRDKYGFQYYKNYETDSLQIREFAFLQPYVSAEPIPEFTWVLEPESRDIGSYKAKKATTHFRGRDYTVWYTEEIPVSEGPWKFSGLPGLILEVTESSGVYSFIATKISFPAPEGVLAKYFTPDGKKLPFEEFIKAEDIEFEKMRQSSMANSSPDAVITKNPTNFIELNYEN